MSSGVYGPTPRVNAGLLPQYAGKNVRIVGKVVSNEGNLCLIEASDGGEIRIQVHAEANIVDPYIELIGRVNEDGTVKMLTCMNMGSDFDLASANKVVEYGQSSKGEGVLF